MYEQNFIKISAAIERSSQICLMKIVHLNLEYGSQPPY